MNLKYIAVKNLLRRKGKAAFVLAGLLIGVSTIVVVISFVDGMTRDINQKLEKYGANILIVPRTENLNLTYGGVPLGGVSFEMKEIREDALVGMDSIKNAANIAAMGPIVLGVVKVNNKKVLLAGVDFEATKILKPWWRLKKTLPEKESIVLGADAARILNLGKGERILIKGRGLIISEVLNPTGSQDDQLIFTDLKTAQSILGKTGQISMVEVAALCNACPIDDMVKQISEVLPGARVMAIQQVVKGRMETLNQFKKFSYGISGVVLLIGSLVVMVTMMSSVRERTDEIGIFRAIGYRRSHVIRILLIETAIISGIAGIFGYIIGLGATGIALHIFAENSNIALPLSLDMAVGAFTLALLIGLLSSVYPAIMAARLDPNEALRAL